MKTVEEFLAAGKNDKLLYLYNELERVKSALNVKEDLPAPKPAQWSNTTVTERPWKPVSNGDVFWTNEHGNVVRRDEVPEDVIAKWEAEKATGND